MTQQAEALYQQAVATAKEKASISYVQRKLLISYHQAENYLERMIADGYITDYQGRRLVNHVDDPTKALQARIAELETELVAERRHKPARDVAAVRTLAEMGYDWHGGEQWKPPIGKAPDFDLIDSLRTRITELEAQHGRKPLDTRTVVSDDELAKAFAGTNFGDADHRQELHVAVLKKACGYHCGHTITTIMRELGLIGASNLPTKKGRKLISLAFHQYMVGGP